MTNEDAAYGWRKSFKYVAKRQNGVQEQVRILHDPFYSSRKADQVATTINKKLREFSKKNNHRLIGFLIETERKNTLQFEGCVRVEDVAKVVELLKEVIEISAKAKEGNDEKHDGTTSEET